MAEDKHIVFSYGRMNPPTAEESGGWFKTRFDELNDPDLDFLEYVEDIQTDWLDELC